MGFYLWACSHLNKKIESWPSYLKKSQWILSYDFIIIQKHQNINFYKTIVSCYCFKLNYYCSMMMYLMFLGILYRFVMKYCRNLRFIERFKASMRYLCLDVMIPFLPQFIKSGLLITFLTIIHS